MSKKTLIAIVGPTAVGKTSTCVELAKHYKTEVLSADSRQFYQEIGIGTAKPRLEELDGVNHHFLDFLPLESDYTAGDYERQALAKLQELFEQHDKVILTGGSGLFVKAVTQGLDEIPRDTAIRAALNQRAADEGLEVLAAELKQLDAKSHERIDLKNPQRVVRALEVCLASGKAYSDFLNAAPKSRPFDTVLIGLRREMPELEERIANRCTQMFDEGWLDECRSVQHLAHLNALNTVGYKELFIFLKGEISEQACRELIVLRTRQFAKRQMTWFKAMSGIEWFDLPQKELLKTLIAYIDKT